MIHSTTLAYEQLRSESTSPPESQAGWLSLLTFSWLGPLMRRGYNKDLEMDDMDPLSTHDAAKHVWGRFSTSWQEECSKKQPSLAKALLHSLGAPFIAAGFIRATEELLSVFPPVFMKLLIEFASNADSVSEAESVLFKGLLIAGAMFVTSVVRITLLHQQVHLCKRTGIRVKSALTSAIYQKTLHLSNSSKQQATVGQITNLMSVDAARVGDIVEFLHTLWSAPYKIGLILYLLYQVLGQSAFAGLVIMLAVIPINSWIATQSKLVGKMQMSNRDVRTKLMSEILAGIKIIKLNAWEGPFTKKVKEIRDKEMEGLKSLAYFTTLQFLTWFSVPVLVSISTFALYSYLSPEPLNSVKIFVPLVLFKLLDFPLRTFPSVIAGLIDTSISLERIQQFLLTEELESHAGERFLVNETAGHFHHANCTYKWQKSGPSILRDINLDVAQGTLVTVVGSVGSGKSSLVSAVLGEMHKTSGQSRVHGSIAFVPQTPWILSTTLRENILFGRSLDEEFYQQVLHACCLEHDLNMLPDVDMTLIGERGINLSGGQKQRVSIARAVYSQADIYLLDDCLSAVDAHVGRAIFDNVIGTRGLLSKRTRLLVTHAIQFLPETDYIIMLKEGSIVESGTYSNLVSKEGLVYKLLKEFGKKTDHSPEPEMYVKVGPERNVVTNSKMPSTKEGFGSRDVRLEATSQGSVARSVYATYVLACGAGTDNEPSVAHRLVVYAALGFGSVCVYCLQTYCVRRWCGIRSAENLHDRLLQTVLRLPQSFFDVTPTGQVLNRFAKDVYAVDEVLPNIMQDYASNGMKAASEITVNSIGSYFFILPMIPLSYLYFSFQKFYLTTSRDLKRLDSISRAPIFANFQETIEGVTSIRAYNQIERFTAMNELLVDYHMSANYAFIASKRWLGLRLECLGSLVVFFSALFVVGSVATQNYIAPSIVGLMLTYSLTLTGSLNALLRQSCEIETNIVSVERIKEYLDLEQEAAYEKADSTPPPSWPERGVIEFKNYSTRYRPDLDLVLKDVSFKVKSGEKVGVVGRTGAGKSSLTLALFRVVEAAAGQVLIDDTDISELGLFDVRSKLAIIPQDPFLFTGTLRDNLDPYHTEEDHVLWEALEITHLKSMVAELPCGLDTDIIQGGENLSVGQRQLVCLARAVLRRAKILVLDEATAAIDYETDILLQSTLREVAKSTTVITIAHRIHTIIDYDKILVLGAGRVLEFDSPDRLLQDTTGVFYSLAKAAGLVT